MPKKVSVFTKGSKRRKAKKLTMPASKEAMVILKTLFKSADWTLLISSVPMSLIKTLRKTINKNIALKKQAITKT